MKKFVVLLSIFALCLGLMGFGCEEREASQEVKDSKQANSQQSQYAKRQPIPFFDWSLERHLVIQLYQIRNRTVATHAVWRGMTSQIEGDCPCLGFGIPYDTSLTNPLQGYGSLSHNGAAVTSIGQAEPNGIFASQNTAATWVPCVGKSGAIEPIYVESKVTVYPYPVKVDYTTNRVIKAGESTVKITVPK